MSLQNQTVSITATGAGSDSSLLVRGSGITAGNQASLQADGAINFLAAQNTCRVSTLA